MIHYSAYVWSAYGLFLGLLSVLAYRAYARKKKTTAYLIRWFSRAD